MRKKKVLEPEREAGMGRANMRADTIWARPARARSRPGPLSVAWAVACHGQEILFQTRTGTSPSRWFVPFPLFFSLKLLRIQKKQHKTWVNPADPWAWAGPRTKSGNFMPGLARPVISQSPRAEPMNMPDPCPSLT